MSRWQDDPNHPVHDFVVFGFGACVLLIALGIALLLAVGPFNPVAWIPFGLAGLLLAPLFVILVMMMTDAVSEDLRAMRKMRDK